MYEILRSSPPQKNKDEIDVSLRVKREYIHLMNCFFLLRFIKVCSHPYKVTWKSRRVRKKRETEGQLIDDVKSSEINSLIRVQNLNIIHLTKIVMSILLCLLQLT